MSVSLQGLSQEVRSIINQLFNECIKEDITTHSIQSIVLAHQHFLGSETFFVGIVWFFHTVDEIAQFRVLKVVKKWIELFRPAFQNTKPLGKIVRSFHEFLESFKPELAKYLQLSLDRDPALGKSEDNLVFRKECESMWMLPVPQPISTAFDIPHPSGSRKIHHYFPLAAFTAAQVAAAMTLRDHALVSCIDTNELLKKKWTFPGQSPTLQVCSDRIDRLCYWSTFQIISCPDCKVRVKIVDFFLKICERLVELKNFNSLFGIYLGLTKLNEFGRGDVLKASKLVDMKKRIKEICDYNNNFHGYRSLLKSCNYPLIEFQEIFLKDMLLISEGTPDFDADSSHIMMDKLYQMGTAIQRVIKSKDARYDIEINTQLEKYLSDEIDGKLITSEHLDALSLYIRKMEQPNPSNDKEKDTILSTTSSLFTSSPSLKGLRRRKTIDPGVRPSMPLLDKEVKEREERKLEAEDSISANDTLPRKNFTRFSSPRTLGRHSKESIFSSTRIRDSPSFDDGSGSLISPTSDKPVFRRREAQPSLNTGHLMETLSEGGLKESEHVRIKPRSDGFDVSPIYPNNSPNSRNPSPRFSITTSPASDYRYLGSLASSSPPSTSSINAHNNLSAPPEKTLSNSNKTSPRLSPTKTSPSHSFSSQASSLSPKQSSFTDAGLDGSAWHAVTTANLMHRERSSSKTSPRSPKTSPSHSPRLDMKIASIATTTINNNGISNYFNAVVATPTNAISCSASNNSSVNNSQDSLHHSNERKINTNAHLIADHEPRKKKSTSRDNSPSSRSLADSNSLLSSSNNSEKDNVSSGDSHSHQPLQRTSTVTLRNAMPPLPTPPTHDNASTNTGNNNSFS